jgi:hypothetical protein
LTLQLFNPLVWWPFNLSGKGMKKIATSRDEKDGGEIRADYSASL